MGDTFLDHCGDISAGSFVRRSAVCEHRLRQLPISAFTTVRSDDPAKLLTQSRLSFSPRHFAGRQCRNHAAISKPKHW